MCTVRHSKQPDRRLNFGSLNVRSLESKLDSVYKVRREHTLDVLFLVETWHDNDSTCLCRLRADGFQTVDRPHPRARDDTLAQNHGSVAVISFTGARLQPVDLATLSHLCSLNCCAFVSCPAHRRVSSLSATGHAGSIAVSTHFYSELANVLDRLATFVEPVSVVGDLNVRLDRVDDLAAIQLVDVLADHVSPCRPMILVGYLTSLPRETTCHHLLSKLWTLVFETIVYCSGQCP